MNDDSHTKHHTGNVHGHGHHGRSFQDRCEQPHGPIGHMPSMRVGRGMVEPAILQVLSEKPMHGYEIISTIEQKTEGAWRPSAGSVYPTLQLLEDKQLIRSVPSDDGDGKKIYEITSDGIHESEQHTPFEARMWNRRADSLRRFHGVREDLGISMQLMRGMMRRGSDAQKMAIQQEVRQFRDTIESIAEGEIN